MTACPFCKKIEEGDVARFDQEVYTFTPLSPVTTGHRLFVPRAHYADAAEDPWTTARVMFAASTYASARNLPANIVTSIGTAATQTVFHLHIHYVPRRPGDGLTLPWTGQSRDGE